MSDKNSTADDKKIVYLEDIVTAPVAKPDPTPPSSGEAMKGTKVVAVVGAVVAGTKRQMTLESFGSKITNKKAKLSTGSSASTSITTTGVSRPAFGIQPLNFIPFSLADFQNSLSPMDRDLLQLECETMGKSWVSLRSLSY
jgi:uracil-DNA glycosylase